MLIRLAVPADLPEMLKLYAAARVRMAESGNPHQWGDEGYPSRELLEEDIRRGISHVMADETGRLCGVFVFFVGEDPDYAVIDGAWKKPGPCGIIHRIAGDGVTRGIVAAAVAYALRSTDSVRIDTHDDNRVMQHTLEKNGFTRCGIIHLADGSPRIAYQLV